MSGAKRTEIDLEAIERDNARVCPARSTVERLVAEVRQLRREYRCAECQHNVERAEKAERLVGELQALAGDVDAREPESFANATRAVVADLRERAEKAERAEKSLSLSYMDLMAERNQIHAERDENMRAFTEAQAAMQRQLDRAERERDEALRQRDARPDCMIYSSVCEDRDNARTERDEARAALADAERERDEARVALAEALTALCGDEREDERDEARAELVRVAEAVRDACAAACYNDSYDAVVAVDLPAIIQATVPS